MEHSKGKPIYRTTGAISTEYSARREGKQSEGDPTRNAQVGTYTIWEDKLRCRPYTSRKSKGPGCTTRFQNGTNMIGILMRELKRSGVQMPLFYFRILVGFFGIMGSEVWGAFGRLLLDSDHLFPCPVVLFFPWCWKSLLARPAFH